MDRCAAAAGRGDGARARRELSLSADRLHLHEPRRAAGLYPARRVTRCRYRPWIVESVHCRGLYGQELVVRRLRRTDSLERGCPRADFLSFIQGMVRERRVAARRLTWPLAQSARRHFRYVLDRHALQRLLSDVRGLSIPTGNRSGPSRRSEERDIESELRAVGG